MRFPARLQSLACSVLLPGTVLCASLHAQTAEQPPANYHGPDTYGLCAFVAGDTTYYGRIFYVSSYFKIKAQQANEEYARAHANGQPMKGAHCYWSYKESDLATMKEADRRLLGLPGHSARGVETGWAYAAGANSTPGNTVARNTTGGYGNSYNNAATGATNAAQNRYANNGATNTRTAYTTANNNTAYNTASTPAYNTASTTGTTTTSSSSITGNMQQQLSGAKTSAVSSATGSVNDMTTSAVSSMSSGASNAMQGLSGKLFGPRQPKAKNTAASSDASQPGAPGGTGQGGNVGGGGMGMAEAMPPSGQGQGGAGAGPMMASAAMPAGGGAMPAGAPMPAAGPGAIAGAPSAPVEGLVADVAGNQVIINIGHETGLATGTKLAVMHPQRVVKDPATGKVLRTVESQVGTLEITSVDAGSASGTFSGTGVPVVGDKVRPGTK